MTNQKSLLANYQALIERHASQFDPAITNLQELVQASLQEIRRSEQALLTAQEIELKQITDALATDARCLLPTVEFQEFVQEIQQTKRESWYNRKPEPAIAIDPTTWLLTKFDLPIGLTNYQTEEDPYGYDDERTHMIYSYSLCLKLGDQEQLITVPYKRVYNIHESNQSSLKEQIDYYIVDGVTDLLMEIKYPESQREQLAQEISILVGYATKLLTLTPRIARFEYKSI